MPLALKLCSAAVDNQRRDQSAAASRLTPPSHAGTLSPVRTVAVRALQTVEESKRRKAAGRRRCIADGNRQSRADTLLALSLPRGEATICRDGTQIGSRPVGPARAA